MTGNAGPIKGHREEQELSASVVHRLTFAACGDDFKAKEEIGNEVHEHVEAAEHH